MSLCKANFVAVFLVTLCFHNPASTMMSKISYREEVYREYVKKKSTLLQYEKGNLPKKHYATLELVIEYLLTAAEERHVQAMDDFHKFSDVISSWAKQDLMTEKWQGVKMISRLFDEGNSFAAVIVDGLISDKDTASRYKDLFTFSLEQLVSTASKCPFFLHLHGVKPLVEKGCKLDALKKLEPLVKQRYLPSIRLKAVLLLEVGSTEAIAQSILISRELANMGDEGQMNNLGSKLQQFPEHMRFAREDFYWLQQAADRGHCYAAGNLALRYVDELDFEQADNYLKRAQEIYAAAPIPSFLGQLKTIATTIEAQRMASSLNTKFSLTFEMGTPGTSKFDQMVERQHALLSAFLAEIEELATLLDLDSDDEEPEIKSVDEIANTFSALPKFLTDPSEDSHDGDGVLEQPFSHGNEQQHLAVIDKPEQPVCTEAHKPTTPTCENVKSSRKTNPAPQVMDTKDAPPHLVQNLAERLKRVRPVVDAVLTKRPVTNKELRSLLNALKTTGPTNSCGSHNNFDIALDDEHKSKRTLVKRHKGSSPYTNAKKIRSVFNKFGITSIDQLWDG